MKNREDRKDRHGEPTHEPVKSPCTGFCILDEYGYCGGCHRSMVEILAWPDMSEEQKRRVLDQIAERAARGKTPSRPKG
ncbi:MAG: DUF1289 domain-containing protein [Candidatus Sumerlaeia bacterium]